MSKKRIKEIAIQHFNRLGYEGTKMAQIAEEAGIRKQSLAYHYSSKKALLLELYEEVVQEEQQFVRQFFSDSVTQTHALDQQLYAFLHEHKNRFLTHPNVAFMYILSFITPLEVHDFVLAQYRTYLGTLKKELAAVFTRHPDIRLSPEEATVAFVTVMDGLDVQLVYETRQSYEQALAITWNVFWSGIQR
ncbi:MULTISPECIES: TetR/AcrR family transcriptional regulator [Paenibacillus]|uniref:TetR/AcrR family transcriptional regulator n=1 Tax=Paenibacillus TaxID=44249 RepID=UPI000B87FBBB|nr:MULTISPECIES: TetR/AcrR family transcriptional regulator [Paenibacillus]MBD8839211.1 TetR/AcrR family transcriptional regulator [Paenibacillus sp. CFBP 13594]PRA05684.1 TetR/AcrR family transcriptional regulator [Paenibacillus sp. MYb63]PRA49966.1 TetR/AcrR family transcriptional regulator [Paenibacillus sp. MYb67]QZN75630.1 TetR/AcrR family transcriptional regulator [Paenibacillus sp. DR312]